MTEWLSSIFMMLFRNNCAHFRKGKVIMVNVRIMKG